MLMNKETDKATEALLCTGICLIWYGITRLIGITPLHAFLTENGVLMPVLCLLEFSVLVPLWRWYNRYYDGVPSGALRLRPLLLFGLLLLALIFPSLFIYSRKAGPPRS